jgi:hypothetical protein
MNKQKALEAWDAWSGPGKISDFAHRPATAARGQGSDLAVAKLRPAGIEGVGRRDWPALELAGAVHPNPAISLGGVLLAPDEAVGEGGRYLCKSPANLDWASPHLVFFPIFTISPASRALGIASSFFPSLPSTSRSREPL